ncbi:hypothetical protein K504DRAFT_456193 [Pleomassaria siparia CBS 279.74]|uniref:Secreted protein n=1 Tax=Pleomassaria siparia CBS 279.74 TaxID=1314801 RepID=A0A6G1K5R7_9PLEO|nr:hypothetical protein K504DRAFT_456193 [Pleomassaria siparia CBS 279.74]
MNVLNGLGIRRLFCFLTIIAARGSSADFGIRGTGATSGSSEGSGKNLGHVDIFNGEAQPTGYSDEYVVSTLYRQDYSKRGSSIRRQESRPMRVVSEEGIAYRGGVGMIPPRK